MYIWLVFKRWDFGNDIKRKNNLPFMRVGLCKLNCDLPEY